MLTIRCAIGSGSSPGSSSIRARTDGHRHALGAPAEGARDAERSGEIALRSRGTPRIANRLLRRVRDYAEVKGTGEIDRKVPTPRWRCWRWTRWGST